MRPDRRGAVVAAGHAGHAADEVKAEERPIALAGCIQRETEYRRQNNSGKGGFLGFGGGLGDEYVLVNASRGADGAFGDCTTATGGEAYELTGPAEDDLEPFVGQRVAITVARAPQEPPPFEEEQDRTDTNRVDTSAGQPPQGVDDDRLPRTDSPLALTGLLGILSLAGVAVLRTRRRRYWL